MRKSAVLLLALLLSSVQATLAQQTRPRRVGQTTPATGTQTQSPRTTPAQTTQTTPAQTTSGRPPTLGGANNSGSVAQTDANAAQAPAKDEPVELGEGDILRVSTTLVTVPVSVLDR